MNKIISYASVIISSLRKRGLKETFRFIIGEYWFDIRYQVNTRPHLLDGDNGIIGSHLSTASPHYGTNWFLLSRVFRDLIQRGLINPPSTHMVDFGCGAGRAMMIAYCHGIAKVTGVEFSKTLCLRAEENLRKFSKRNATGSGFIWRVAHEDACSFVIPQDAALFFLYNPFGNPVIDIVAQRILDHARSIMKPVIVIYVNPVHDAVFRQLGYLKLAESDKEVAIYASR